MDLYAQFNITYPSEWEQEYKLHTYVRCWRERYPEQFNEWKSTIPGTLDLFAQYALMYLLRDQGGIQSITWYGLNTNPDTSSAKEKTLALWAKMRQVMGDHSFDSLHQRVTGVRGEPDLFCWHPETQEWFFAEAKRKDKLSVYQLEWFRIYRECLCDAPDIRVYQLNREKG